jgi:hypothetical protein
MSECTMPSTNPKSATGDHALLASIDSRLAEIQSFIAIGSAAVAEQSESARNKWITVFQRELEPTRAPHEFRPRGDDSLVILTPAVYERYESNKALYAPAISVCAHYDTDEKSIVVDASDPNFLIVRQALHKPGYDGPEFRHYIPWNQICDVVIGRHG